MVEDERFTCHCGGKLGELQGNWWVYPNPAICPECKTDNSEPLKHFIIDSVIKTSTPKRRKAKA